MQVWELPKFCGDLLLMIYVLQINGIIMNIVVDVMLKSILIGIGLATICVLWISVGAGKSRMKEQDPANT